MKTDELVKVVIPLNEEAANAESLWAEPLDPDRFRLRNVPFVAKGYAENDIVQCQFRNGALEVIGILENSGNGTLWLMFVDSTNAQSETILQELNSVGCTYERAAEQLVALTVPSNLAIPFSQVANYLNSLDNSILPGWEIGKQFIRSTPI